MNGISTSFAAVLKRDLKRLLQEVEGFPEGDAIWQTAPGMNNSPGNLVLHLEGNLREYIGRQLGGVEYQRVRPREFSDKGVTVAELRARVERLIEEIPPVLAALSAEDLERDYPENVLGSPISTGQFMVHLIGHFNYHLGQIDSARRAATGPGAVAFAGL
jgi:Protein of unknown function (DUF664)